MYIMLKWKLQIEKIEDLDIWSKLGNLSFVHFIFTLKLSKTWDGEMAFQFARKSYSNWSFWHWLWQEVGTIFA